MSEQANTDQIEILQEFLREVRELLEDLEPSIIGLEEICKRGTQLESTDIETFNGIFRLFHSMKGGAGFLQLNNIVNSTHTAETLLDKLRTGSLQLSPAHVDVLCQACDFTKEALDYVEIHLNDEGMTVQADKIAAQINALLAPPAPEAPPAAKGKGKGKKAALAPPPFDLHISMEDLITPETRERFLQEADDILQDTEQALLQLPKNPANQELIERIFRNIHSFKGNCGFLGFKDLEELAHQEESLLDALRSGTKLECNKVADMLLELIDTHKEALADIAKGGKGAVEGLPLYLELLQSLLPKEIRPAGAAKPPSSRLGEILVEQGLASNEDIAAALEQQVKPLGELLTESGVVSAAQVANALQLQEKGRPEGAAPPAEAKGSVSTRQDIRVDLNKLDTLVNLIGEMVIAENMLIHNPDLAGLELENFNKASQHMTKIVRELQEMAMTIRMIPVSGLFRRMIRLVHDLSRKSGKKVDLQLEGENTEVDKTVIEKITDPLVHLIRNSMDHGLEDPADRIAAGKPEVGVIKLTAGHEEGKVKITITDDGRGLNRPKILAKAIERGLIEGDGSQMSSREIYNLIFLPGFSTADKVTDISGRGVGMDVVRQNLEAIKGKVDIASTSGQGSTISLRIPLTLAIIDGMLIRTGSSFYILPILVIRESFRPTPQAITVTPDGEELVRVRDKLLPVIRLHKLHNIVPDHHELEQGILIVLETHDNTNLCLFADELMGQQQTVIKSLADYLAKLGNVSGVSGCTILGNGEVCLILDVHALHAMNKE